MGQYHFVLNPDKKQMFNGLDIDSGLKLVEQMAEKCSSDALFLLLANSNGRGGGDVPHHPLIGSWAGDRIVVQGDYAEPSDPGFVSGNYEDEFTDISSAVKEMLDVAFNT